MAVWSKVNGVIEKHDGQKPMFSAAARISFACAGGATVEQCAIYRRDPAKNPDEPNVLPEKLEKARRKGQR